jgi:hypothetical protein
MTIDNDFVAQFEAQIGLLEKMEKSVKEAIGKARDDLKLLRANPGKNVEDVIHPDPPKK